MSDDQRQLNNNDDFLEFDFDEDDLLVKDEDGEIKTLNQKIEIGQQIKKGLKIGHQIDTPLDLKEVKIDSQDSIEEMRENLVKQANMQREKAEALDRTGEGLVYDEKDEEEIEKFRRRSLSKGYPDIDVLARNLISKIDIVPTLKIDLIQRLKNIIDSYLRDVRDSVATEELLQRSLDGGGLNLSADQTAQIMEFIKTQYKKIHSAIPVSKLEIEEFKKDDIVESSEDEMVPISKKTAREAQVGVFSNEIIDFKRQREPKDSFSYQDKDLAQWEKGLAISSNLRIPEISAPKGVKKITAESGGENLRQKRGEDEVLRKKKLLADFQREEVLKSLNEALEQEERKSGEIEKKRTSWWSRLFFRKSFDEVEDELNNKRENELNEMEANKKKQNLVNVQGTQTSLKERSKVSNLKDKAFFQQPLVRRVSVDRQNRQNFDNYQKMEDVKVVRPHLVGPIEELSEMTILDFRRLGSTTQDSVDKIKEKVELAAKEFFNQRVAAINAWKKSQTNQLYLELVRDSLSKKVPIEYLIEQYKLAEKPTLTKEEFYLISQLNKELRY